MNFSIRRDLTTEERENLNEFSDKLAKILFHRGLVDNLSAKKFFEITYDDQIHDPFLMKDLERSVERIIKAIQDQEKICIFSDYDADGVPGAVILADFFKKINYQNFFNYIPHRNKEGFGLNGKAVQKISDQGANLIITIDCGIADLEPANLIKKLGIDLIITDHHEPGPKLPENFAIVDPKQKDCDYPYKNLCGAGVIFKVIQGLIKKGNFEIGNGWEKWLLDMVGIATLADMVPLTGENRVLAKYGLLVLKKTRRKGLIKLFKDCKINHQSISEDDIGFTIAPRINAASRMDAPELAFDMLSTDDEILANQLVSKLHKINDERKGVVASMVKEIKHHLDKGNEIMSVIVRGNPNWQPSLLGLAASSIVENYKRPVFLWGKGEGDNFKGSCRSDGSVSLVELMHKMDDGFIYDFGGHEMAGGFSVSEKGIFDLEEKIIQAFTETKKEDFLHKDLVIDDLLNLEDVNWKFFNEINKLSPFGIENEKPTFLFKNLKANQVIDFGKNKEHRKILLKKKNGEVVPIIKFFAGSDEKIEQIRQGLNFNLIANLEQSFFGSFKELRLRVIENLFLKNFVLYFFK